MPSIPKNNGRIKISGSKNKICRVMDKNNPLTGWPIAVKNVEEIGCRQFKNVQKKKTRKYEIANSKYKASPEPNREVICRGNS